MLQKAETATWNDGQNGLWVTSIKSWALKQCVQKSNVLLWEEDDWLFSELDCDWKWQNFTCCFMLWEEGRELLSPLFWIDLNGIGQILIDFHFCFVPFRSGSGKTVPNVITDQQISNDDDDQFVVEAAPPVPEMPEMEMVC